MFSLLIKSLKQTINSLEEENKELKEKVKMLERDNVIILDNSRELREKITDLENNLELVVNELTPKKREKLGL